MTARKRPGRPPGARGATPRRFTLRPVGYIRSTLTERKGAPRQGSEGAPDAWLEIEPWAAKALFRVKAGDELLVLTWLHQGRRNVFQVHPRSDPKQRLHGVFATRSPDRPNPIGLHRVEILAIDNTRIHVRNLEAVDGTPVVDIKPQLGPR